jgi:hypothetical protein
MRRAAAWLYRISDRVLWVVLAAGVLTSPLYRADYFREHLFGHAVVPAGAGLAVLLLGVGLAWRSLLRRDFAWLDPARLTWDDATDARVGTIGRRLWTGWFVRFAAVGYVTGVAAALLRTTAWLPAGGVLLGATALLAVVLGRRSPGRAGTWLEYLVPVGFAVLAGTAVLTAVPSGALLLLGTVALLAALASLWGSGPVRRPAVAVHAGRDQLVAGYRRRLFRRVNVSFGDVLALLPAPGPVPWPAVFAGRAVVPRFVVAGVVSRSRALLPSALLVVLVAVLHHVFPVIGAVWLVGVGVYLACLPFAASLAQLFAVPGLRRWLGCSDLTLRLATAGVLVVVAAVWVGLVAVFAVPLGASAWLAALIAVGAVVRTVTRPVLDYGNVGVAVAPDGYLVPVGLLVQLAHGPELLVIGILLLGVLASALVAAPVAAAFAGYGIAR